MNAQSKIKRGKTTVFKLNRSQAVRIPEDLAFPEGVRDLIVWRIGNKLVLEPETTFWDEFFNRVPRIARRRDAVLRAAAPSVKNSKRFCLGWPCWILMLAQHSMPLKSRQAC